MAYGADPASRGAEVACVSYRLVAIDERAQAGGEASGGSTIGIRVTYPPIVHLGRPPMAVPF